MSRLSFRPRPLDIHKKLPILKSIKEFEDEESPLNSSTRNSHILRFVAAEVENEIQVHHAPSKKNAPEIPTPESVIVDTYERDYSSTFIQPTSYLRARGARAEIGEFIEYDLDNEDEDWLEEFNSDKQHLTPEKYENILFKFEVLDHRAREKAGVITPTPATGSPNPVLLQLDVASEALQVQSIRFPIIQAVYNYWKEKRGRWQKPILRRLQPPPHVNDTNPYNVFRPREKAHKLHTRRMQRRENNVQSFEKLRQVRRNLEQAKTILESLIKREEKKRDVMESEVSLQRIQLKYRHESELVEDSLALSGFPSFSSRHGFSEEEYMDSDDVSNSRLHIRPAPLQNHHYSDTKPVVQSMGNMKREFRRRHALLGWLLKLDPDEPMLLFTNPLVPDKLAAAGIIPPTPELIRNNDSSTRPHNIRGRIGRGGRIIFERWNPLAQ